METIPSIYWMIIISIITGFLCLIFYYLAMLLKESKETVIEVRETVKKSNQIMDEANEIIRTAKKAVNIAENIVKEVETQIIFPVRTIGGIFQTISGFLEGWKK